MKKIGRKTLFSFFSAFVALLIPLTAAFASNDYVEVDLRHDVGDVYISGDYRVWLRATDIPLNSFPTFSSVWLSVNLAKGDGGYQSLFTQVGLYATSNGLYWFAWSEVFASTPNGAICLQGEQFFFDTNSNKYLGCRGQQYVALNADFLVELVTYGFGNWYARIYDTNGVPHDLAQMPNNSQYIYDATVSVEEGVSQDQDPNDPYVTADYFIYHPQFMNWAEGQFNDWPVSQKPGLDFGDDSIVNNKLYTLSNWQGRVICPAHYGAILNLNNDIRYWFAGTVNGGAISCAGTVMDAYIQNLPMITRN